MAQPERRAAANTARSSLVSTPACATASSAGRQHGPGAEAPGARALQALGVDVLEAGFPAASPGDYEAWRRSPAISKVRPCRSRPANARTSTRDRGAPAAGRKRCHVFLATSPIHREFKLGLTTGGGAPGGGGDPARAGKLDEVEYSAEDAARTEPTSSARW